MKHVITTLCYIEKDDCYLMLHRIKKENDLNKDKWIGVGGKFEEGETPEECLLREVKEETGLTLTSYCLRGVITFISDEWGCEYMFLYTASAYDGQLREDKMHSCEEGVLTWVPKSDIENLNLWEGDKIFFRLLETETRLFSLKLRYKGNELVESKCEFPTNFC
jgi:8-oxo-dGTP diphosphatase